LEKEAAVFLKKPLNKAECVINDVKISAIYGFLESLRAGGEYHDHVSFELHLIRSGSGHMMAVGEAYDFAPDTLILIPPDTGHYPAPDTDTVFEDLTVMFSYQYRPGWEGEKAQGLFGRFQELLPGKDCVVRLAHPFYGECFGKILEAQSEPDPVLGYALMQNLLQGLFLQLLRDLKKARCSGARDIAGKRTVTEQGAAGQSGIREPIGHCDFLIVKRIDEYIQRLSADVTLDGLAEYINMSRRSTQRLVLGLYRQSFTQKLAEFRLNAAAQLIRQNDRTLAQIAKAVGYEEYTTFHKAFVKYFGMLPSEYRKNRKG